MKNDFDFENLILSAFSNESTFNKLSHHIKKVRLIMSEHDAFKRLSTKSQFDICCTICIIAVQTARHDLTKVKHFGVGTSEVFEYSIFEGFNETKKSKK